jgi:DNA ligase (NAD+)
LPDPEDYGLKTHYEALNYMKKLGFNVNSTGKLVNDINEVMAFIDHYTVNREKLIMTSWNCLK